MPYNVGYEAIIRQLGTAIGHDIGHVRERLIPAADPCDILAARTSLKRLLGLLQQDRVRPRAYRREGRRSIRRGFSRANWPLSKGDLTGGSAAESVRWHYDTRASDMQGSKW
jgi:hypothetical protein